MIWGFWAFCYSTFGIIFLGALLVPRTFLCGRAFCVSGTDTLGLFVAIGLGMLAGFGAFGMEAFPPHLSLPRAVIGCIPVAAWCFFADRRLMLGWESRPSRQVTAIRVGGTAAMFIGISWPLLHLVALIWTID